MKVKLGILINALFALTLFCSIPMKSFGQQIKTDGKTTIVQNTVELNKMIHDFGDVMVSDKLLHCSFELKNISNEPIVIFNVISSCGCTNIKWTREPLSPGEVGKINVDYTNDAGPYPFDKTLTVYVSGLKKPIILRLRGIVHAKKKPLGEMYPAHIGQLGMKTTDIKLGNMKQGDSKGDSFKVANLSKTPMKLDFAQVSNGLKIEVSPNPIPAGSVATVQFSISSDGETWGKNYYWFTPLINGQKSQEKVGIWTFTVQNFSGWSKEEIKMASQPIFNTSNYSFGKVKKGTQVTAVFEFKNMGKSDAVIYKADCDWSASNCQFEKTTAPGKSSTIKVELDTKEMPAGEVMWTILLTTNCPLRPYITLYITGSIQ